MIDPPGSKQPPVLRLGAADPEQRQHKPGWPTSLLDAALGGTATNNADGATPVSELMRAVVRDDGATFQRDRELYRVISQHDFKARTP